jgi:hypothetical protein
MRYISYVALSVCTVLLLLFIHSCTQVANLQSEPITLGDGTLRAYVDLDEQNQPQAVGVVFTEAALSGLPPEDTEYVLALPEQANSNGFTHIGFNWRPHGHNPNPIYGSPHFDIHFYTITPDEREGITAMGSDVEKAYTTPAPELVPSGYVLAPDSAEPRMGSHWVNLSAAEFQGEPHGFTHTLIYGFYNGEMAFVEPMIALDFLESHSTVEGTFPKPDRYSREGSYPAAYRISYNEAAKEYRVALTELSQS